MLRIQYLQSVQCSKLSMCSLAIFTNMASLQVYVVSTTSILHLWNSIACIQQQSWSDTFLIGFLLPPRTRESLKKHEISRILPMPSRITKSPSKPTQSLPNDTHAIPRDTKLVNKETNGQQAMDHQTQAPFPTLDQSS